MERCDACGRVLSRPRPVLPLCDSCMSELGLGPAAREYLEELLRGDDGRDEAEGDRRSGDPPSGDPSH